ncbi:MAG: YdiU family protein [Myxococcales bacterium]|nr:YdiU family protein [Myxococcales bacterium]
MTHSIESLTYRSRFVDTLPADPRDDNRTRMVTGAVYSRVAPTPVSAPKLLALVPEVCALLDLDPEPTPELAEVLAGNRIISGMKPYAACYGGHQFGNWASQLGDGRAINLGEVENSRGERWEVQLKGAGPTPYSRRADGRAVLRSSLRELVCSEAMHHLGVPTTRALSLVLTGDGVERDMFYDGNPEVEPGAITCRVAPSFVRFGHFEIHASRDDRATLEKLFRYTVSTLYPQFEGLSLPEQVARLFDEVAERTATMVTHWMRVGFVHGVMNTDNMSILGLTIDYGPYGWLDVFDPGWTPNTTDAQGKRYRFGNQPRIAQWNLAQLGNALTFLVDDVAPLQNTIDQWPALFAKKHHTMMLRKLGLSPLDDAASTQDDIALIDALMEALTSAEVDPTIFYRALAKARVEDPSTPWAHHRATIEHAFYSAGSSHPLDNELVRGRFEAWLRRYSARVQREGVAAQDRAARMNKENPVYIPRNYIAQQVIDRVAKGDVAALEELLAVIRRPYEEQPGREAFAEKRPDWARQKAGCSMLSCSS